MKCPLCGLECCYAELLAENERLRGQLEELAASIDKLPKTGDGVRMVPGRRYWFLNKRCWFLPENSGDVVEGYCLDVSSQSTPVQLEIYECQGPITRLPSRCYSTREAAEAAEVDDD